MRTHETDPELMDRAVRELWPQIEKYDRWLCHRAAALGVGSYEYGAFVGQLSMLAARCAERHQPSRPGGNKLASYFFPAVRWHYLKGGFWRNDTEHPKPPRSKLPTPRRRGSRVLAGVRAPEDKETTWCDEALGMLGDEAGALMEIVRRTLDEREARALLQSTVEGIQLRVIGEGMGKDGANVSRQRVQQLKERALQSLRGVVLPLLASRGFDVEGYDRLGA